MMEDWVIAEANLLFDSIEKDGRDTSICTCSQCRRDAICYVLNRTTPHYVVSHRGVARANLEGSDAQQSRADLTALVYEGIRRVSHNQRPYVDHNKEEAVKITSPVFNIPIIMGRAFDGRDFSPALESAVQLLQNEAVVSMKDTNWQNPFNLIPNTNGIFTFWPAPVQAEKSGVPNAFQYMVKISGGNFEELSYSFTIPVISEESVSPFSMTRTFKLPDLYLFPPGEEKAQLVINA
jgi:competence protein ComFB